MHFFALWAKKGIGIATAVSSVALLLAPGAGAAPSAQSSVIGGEPASSAEFPWLAWIKSSDPAGKFTCTGSVIAPRVILTAGHCVKGMDPFTRALEAAPASFFRVVTGSSNHRKGTGRTESTVEQVVFYPSFSTARLQTDAGLLILSEPVQAPALALATPSDGALLAAGTQIRIAGWGMTASNAGDRPDTARTGTLEIQGAGFCLRRTDRKPNGSIHYTPSRQLCALDRPDLETSGCHGDSGGPAVATRTDGVPVQVGIVSGGSARCELQSPNIFTRVDLVSSWALGWAAAVETGVAPPPTPVAASPPYLSQWGAIQVDRTALLSAFGGHFSQGSGKQFQCRRVTWEALDCRNGWHQGGNRYHGNASVRLEVVGQDVFGSSHLTIHWVGDECAGGRSTNGCAVRTRDVTVRTGPY